MTIKKKIFTATWLCYLLFCFATCKKNSTSPPVINPPPTVNEVDMWLTTGSGSQLLKKQTSVISFTASQASSQKIDIDSAITHQSVDGFGYTLTGGSAYHINRLPEADKTALLNELFSNGAGSIGVSYLRVSLGASDLDEQVFSYNDLPAGQTDLTLTNFSLSKDTVNLIPVLQKILAINPSIKILASPWSPPVWMKDNGSSIGGSLRTQHYGVYANYFVKYIQQMKTKGITIDAITIQNEPFHPGNNPSMYMTALQQADFIKNHLGPAFSAAGIQTKIIIWDHNCSDPEFPLTVLSDPAASQYINGSAFHLYAGDISALSTVHNAYPGKALYFTEQWTGANGTFNGDLVWHVKNVIIGSMRNWSRIALEWNLAADQFYMPHTPGGCTECKGAFTISTSNAVSRNVSYYIIAHAAKFIPPGSVRISSNQQGSLFNAAFLTPSGKKVLIVVNEGTDAYFDIAYKGKYANTAIPASSVATYTW